jgi:hypothetical protein
MQNGFTPLNMTKVAFSLPPQSKQKVVLVAAQVGDGGHPDKPIGGSMRFPNMLLAGRKRRHRKSKKEKT